MRRLSSCSPAAAATYLGFVEPGKEANNGGLLRRTCDEIRFKRCGGGAGVLLNEVEFFAKYYRPSKSGSERAHDHYRHTPMAIIIFPLDQAKANPSLMMMILVWSSACWNAIKLPKRRNRMTATNGWISCVGS